MELQLKDMETVEKRQEKLIRTAKAGNKDAQKELEILKKIISSLERAENVRSIDFIEDDRTNYVKSLQLLTDKPVLYVCNVSENAAANGNEYVEKAKTIIAREKCEVLVLAVSIEADINELESYEERHLFLEDIGLTEPLSLIHISEPTRPY